MRDMLYICVCVLLIIDCVYVCVDKDLMDFDARARGRVSVSA